MSNDFCSVIYQPSYGNSHIEVPNIVLVHYRGVMEAIRLGTNCVIAALLNMIDDCTNVH